MTEPSRAVFLSYASQHAESARDELADISWKPWLPKSTFHFLIKDAPYVGGDWTVEQMMQTIPGMPQPPLFKKLEGAESILLPRHEMESDSFLRRCMPAGQSENLRRRLLDSVLKLLQTTWGVQKYVDSGIFGLLPLKTSPSGGARNPVEVYMMALRVRGLDAGLYHYDTRDHALERVSPEPTPQMARAYCADQPFLAHAAALFIMTGVFARSMWKYHHARAYRVVLLDTGHFGQTFCLTATRLGLAPFNTAALKDTLIKEDLGIDGISESVLYVTGVGMPADQ